MGRVLYVVAVVWVALFVWQTIAHAAPAAMLWLCAVIDQPITQALPFSHAQTDVEHIPQGLFQLWWWFDGWRCGPARWEQCQAVPYG
jgi:hypothetical protein